MGLKARAKKPASEPSSGSGDGDANLSPLGRAVRAHALGLPGAYEEHPWGESVAKVNRKVFVFFGRLSAPDGSLHMSLKLPESGPGLLGFEFAEPTGYGLGKSGWITLSATPKDGPPADLLCQWIDESYRAVAPKKLVVQMSG